ncbi:MAG TPA: sigma-70 family RNA polymerase sigma factor [Steroidobacteraceae bacterium]|nr:sigma-70 family RNA polymerase sigma factor [Steroidobacteraceae bacterium]
MTATTSLDPRLLEQLIARCAQRDPRALEELYRVAAPALFGCLMRMLHRREVAEDALQDVFVRIWQRAGQFDQVRGRAQAWLFSIARYRAIDEIRGGGGRGRDLPLDETHSELPAPDASQAEAGVEFSARESALNRCLEMLGVAQRRCVTLAFVEGYSHDQIAAMVASPLGTVKSWLRRGLSSLRECLES